MLVKCIGNSKVDIRHARDAEFFSRYVHLDEVDLVVGNAYLVYGVFFRDGTPCFLVCEEPDDEYPKPHFGEFFDLVDGRVPPGWSLQRSRSNVGELALLPDPWAADPAFLEKLVEGDQASIALFECLKRSLKAWHAG